MTVDLNKAKKAAAVVTTFAAAVDVHRDADSGEIDKVTFAKVPLFTRDERGNPKVLGIPFRRWFRGSR